MSEPVNPIDLTPTGWVRLHATVLAGLLLALQGCATRSTYEPPAMAKPAAWEQGRAAAMSRDDVAISEWWLPLNDPALNQLMQLALQGNNTLAQAVLKARRARLVAGQAASDQLPTVSAKVGNTATRALESGNTTIAHTATLAASWELDLWGRVAALRDAADFEAQATEADRLASRLSITAAVANAWWQLAYLNQRVVASQQSIDYARQALKLVEAQYAAGSTSGLERAQARQTVAAQEASHLQWVRQQAEARNTLALLVDGAPGSASPVRTVAEPARLPDGALPDVPAGLPAQLLTRRPDLQAAELRLRKTLASGDATRAAYYPTISLTGQLYGAAPSLTDVLSSPQAILGSGLSLPFIQWRDMQRARNIAQVDYELVVTAYRQSWYQALADVDNALNARQQYALQGERLQAALEAAQATEKLAEARYRAGSVALKTWLDAQETRRQAEVNLAVNRLNQFNTWVTLVQTLGG